MRERPAKRGPSAPGQVRVEAADLEELMLRVARDQDRGAFSQLFLFYAPRLKSFLQRQGADSAQAEEIAQEALLTLWRKAASFDVSQATVSTWLFTIARNKRIDRLRREKAPQLDPDDPALVTTLEPVDQMLQGRQDARRVQKALKALPPEQAALIQMAYFEDRAHSDIAAQTALPLGTVKSRLRLALTRLRKLLKEEA